MNYSTLKTSLVITATILATAGCAKDNEFFPEADGSRPAMQMMETQVKAGVRDDSNLYPAHFEGEELSSLGMAKLDTIASAARPGSAVVVNLQDEDHDRMVRRMEAVAAYLKDRGLQDDQITFADTFSAGSYTPAAAGLANLAKTDTGSESSESGPMMIGIGQGLGAQPK